MDSCGNLTGLDLVTALSFVLTLHNTELAEHNSKVMRNILNNQGHILEKLEIIERGLSNGPN